MMGEGLKAQARIELSNATRSLIKALGILKDVKSEESRAILKALDSLAKVTPDVDEAVGQSEIKSLLAGAETAVPGRGAGVPAPAGMGIGGGPPRPMAAAGMPFGGMPTPPMGGA